MKISVNKLKGISFLYIIMPIIIFFIGWIRIYISIPLTGICILLFMRYIKSHHKEEIIILSKKTIFLIFFIAGIWCLFGGIGKVFYQPDFFPDHVIRNTIFRDLITESWPVNYSKDFYLCYYIGQWLVPAVIGKLLLLVSNLKIAFNISNIILYVWSVLGVCLIFIWIIKIFKTKSFKRIFLILLSFIFFAGLDLIGSIILNKCFPKNLIFAGFEWWTNNKVFQYSSFTALIFWSYNQAIVPILITLILYDNQDYKNQISLLILGLIYGPYPMLGLALYLIAINTIKCIQKKSFSIIKQYLSIQNILAMVFILPIFVLYYMANYKIANYSSMYFATNLTFEWWLYILFILLEFLIYIILIYDKHNDQNTELVVVSFALMLIPFKNTADFIMRVSVPFLLILWINIVKFILNPSSNKIRKKVLLFILIIAATSPLTEFARGIYHTKMQGYIGSSLKEIDLMLLDDYYKYNYISDDYAYFYKYIAKEGFYATKKDKKNR